MSSNSIPSTSTNTSLVSDCCYQEQADGVIPDVEQIGSIYARSMLVWQELASSASAMNLTRDIIDLTYLSERLPELPNNMREMTELCGLASWDMKSTGCIDPRRTRMQEERRWKPTTRRPTLCTISNRSSFNHVDSKSNGISCLFFAWAYILSKNLLEKQNKPVFYGKSTSQPRPGKEPKDGLTVDLGDASDEECRWWVALLAPGQGWRSVDDEQPIWSVAYTGNMHFRVVARSGSLAPTQYDPPSSSQALKFLSRFTSMYNLESQSALALAMALTLPVHNYTLSMVWLPKPYLIPANIMRVNSSSIDQKDLVKLMTFSSNPLFLSSALWSVFWEPGLHCNLVSPWFDPIIDVLEPLIAEGNMEKLGHVLALRQPNIGPLWYGIVACGNTKIVSGIIPFLRTLNSPILSGPIPEVAAWTGCPQSFMDLCGSGLYVRKNNQVAREDVWRLRHELWDAEPEGAPFQRPPNCPWPPFGYIRVEELEIPVRAHIGCPRHHWVYRGWSWILCNGSEELIEPPFELESSNLPEVEPHIRLFKNASPPLFYQPNHVASEAAVGDIFRWALTEMDLTGQDIYKHPWVDAVYDLHMGDLDCEESISEQDKSAELSLRRVNDWIVNQL